MVIAYGGCQPLEPLPVGQRVGKQVAGIAQGKGAVALQLPPDLNPLAGPLCGQAKEQEQPGDLYCFCYTHFICMLILYLKLSSLSA